MKMHIKVQCIYSILEGCTIDLVARLRYWVFCLFFFFGSLEIIGGNKRHYMKWTIGQI